MYLKPGVLWGPSLCTLFQTRCCHLFPHPTQGLVFPLFSQKIHIRDLESVSDCFISERGLLGDARHQGMAVLRIICAFLCHEPTFLPQLWLALLWPSLASVTHNPIEPLPVSPQYYGVSQRLD